MFKLEEHKNVYFIGIGGISMSSLAEILISKGYNITGSNNVENEMTEKLKSEGIKINIGHHKENITSDYDLVVYTAAINSENEELLEAQNLKIETIRREILLSAIMDLHKNKIAISGTHGKTTTSSMISEIFITAKKDPTLSIGGIVNSINSNTLAGGDEYFVAEACEYKDSFLSLNPSIGLILNVDADHLDYFENLDAIKKSFLTFASHIEKGGHLIINNNCYGINEFKELTNCDIVTYGNSTADYRAENITYSANGNPTFDVIYKGEKITTITLKVLGYHNVSNALAAIAASMLSGINIDDIKSGLENFMAPKRRMELRGEINGIRIYDDYAHHPTEIKASITAFNSMPKNKLYVVFQSHTYTRTKALLNEFATSLADADNIIITDIYAARETNDVNVHPEDLVNLIKEINPNVTYISGFDNIANHIKKVATKNDIVAMIGAGDVNKICDILLKK